MRRTTRFLAALCCLACAAGLAAGSSEGIPIPISAAVTVQADVAVASDANATDVAVVSDAPAPTVAADANFTAEVDAVATNTFYRSQADLTTTDASTEENIPGLEPTNPKKVWRSVPNLEHLSPFLTLFIPFLPTLKPITSALDMHFPATWPLAGTGPTKDWLTHVGQVYFQAFAGTGPKPPIAPTILLPAPSAYAKLKADMHAYSGLPDLKLLDPVKKAIVATAVHQQLLSNLVIVAAPKLAKAENNTVMMTLGKTKLRLEVRPDGSRWLVSNTTSAKLLATDIVVQRDSAITVQVVDNFVVGKMSPVPPKPEPLFSAEDWAKLPEELSMMQQAIEAMPKAASEMPGAMSSMLLRQLPQEQQDALKNVASKIRTKLALFKKVP